MAARANWFLGVVEGLEEEPDPFSMPIEEVGERIDLRDPQAALRLRLDELLQREGHLFERGVTCAIKDRVDTSCHACPVSRTAESGEALAALCRLGREQERVLTELAVHQCQGT